MKARLAVAPIAWSNDDLPELGGDTPLETCLREARAAGFSGVEQGGKVPTTAPEMTAALAPHGLVLASGWYSGTVLRNEVEAEIDQIAPQLEMYRDCGAPVIFYGETAGSVQGKRNTPIESRPRLSDDDFIPYARRMTALAEHCAEVGVPLAFHHHMATAVETEREVDLLMRHSGEALKLLLDPGHMVFAGGDPIGVAKTHAARIAHVHAKDVRADVLARTDATRASFIDAILDGIFTVPGDGMIDYGAIARTLADIGYEGWVVVEAEQDPAKANPFEYSRLGFETMTAALEQAGYEIVA